MFCGFSICEVEREKKISKQSHMEEGVRISNGVHFERKFLQKFDDIVQRLDLLIQLSIPPPETGRTQLTQLEHAVYGLCDLQHSRKEIAKTLKKSSNLVSVTLHRLKKKRLIRSARFADRTCYLRLRG